MRRDVTLRTLLWTVRIALLPALGFWLLFLSQVVANYWRGGAAEVEGWFMHITAMSTAADQRNCEHLLFLSHKNILTLVALLLLTELLVWAHWRVNRKLNRTTT
jgi:hypothetical protein